MGHTISRKSIKKIITILTAAILVLLPVGGSIREVHAEGEESSDSGMSLEHEKTVTENADGTYDLKLTVKGKVNSESSKAPLDVIYVLDRSGSMAYPMDRDSQNTWENNGERRNAASQAINSMTNTLADNENLDVRFALVTFSGNKSDYWPGGYRDDAWNDAKIAVNWTNQASAIMNQTSPESDGGTNYQAGIRSAKGLLNGKRQNAKTAVIFVSDGDPTFRYRSDGYTEGDGSSDEDGKSLKAGKDAVADMQTDYFFTLPELSGQDRRCSTDCSSGSNVRYIGRSSDRSREMEAEKRRLESQEEQVRQECGTCSFSTVITTVRNRVTCIKYTMSASVL